MPLNIKDDRAHDEAKQLARLTGESITDAVRTAIRERLDRVRKTKARRPLVERVQPIIDRFAARPVLDDRSPDEIIGYDEKGLPR